MKKIATLCVLALVSNFAFAADYVVRIENKTGTTLNEIYLSHEKSKDWEENILEADEVLEPNESFKINIEDYKSPWFDVRDVSTTGESFFSLK